MERVSTLIKKLQQQLDEKVSVSILLHTVQMLHSELQSYENDAVPATYDKVSVILPSSFHLFKNQNLSDSDNGDTPADEKIIEVLQVDEKAIEEELEQIKRNAEAMNSLGTHTRPSFYFDSEDEVPTLAHQTPIEEVNDTKKTEQAAYPESLNDRLKEVRVELSEKLTEAPIKDLKKAIGINDRFLFINELFRGDEAMYERSIKTIQNFSILAEAEFWIKRELKVKIGWHDNDPAVKQFDQLVRRRFS